MRENIQRTLQMICKTYNVEMSELFSESKVRYLFYVRVIAAYILRKYYRLSTTKTGEFLARDHSTIVYYGKSYKDLKKYDATFREMLNSVSYITLEIKDEFQMELEDEFSEIIKINDGN